MIRARLDTWLVILPQVHPSVQRCDLVGVSVEHQRLPPPKLPDAPLGRLAPPRMVNCRVHVGVEAVFSWRRFLPRGVGLLTHKPDPHDRLCALKPVLPRYDD